MTSAHLQDGEHGQAADDKRRRQGKQGNAVDRKTQESELL
jgi:hypothetical protein